MLWILMKIQSNFWQWIWPAQANKHNMKHTLRNTYIKQKICEVHKLLRERVFTFKVIYERSNITTCIYSPLKVMTFI